MNEKDVINNNTEEVNKVANTKTGVGEGVLRAVDSVPSEILINKEAFPVTTEDYDKAMEIVSKIFSQEPEVQRGIELIPIIAGEVFKIRNESNQIPKPESELTVGVAEQIREVVDNRQGEEEAKIGVDKNLEDEGTRILREAGYDKNGNPLGEKSQSIKPIYNAMGVNER